MNSKAWQTFASTLKKVIEIMSFVTQLRLFTNLIARKKLMFEIFPLHLRDTSIYVRAYTCHKEIKIR